MTYATVNNLDIPGHGKVMIETFTKDLYGEISLRALCDEYVDLKNVPRAETILGHQATGREFFATVEILKNRCKTYHEVTHEI